MSCAVPRCNDMIYYIGECILASLIRLVHIIMFMVYCDSSILKPRKKFIVYFYLRMVICGMTRFFYNTCSFHCDK